jgi:predicted ester cyclase
MGGGYDGRDWVCATGYFVGTFARDWLSIPATGQKAYIRFGEFCQMAEGRIAKTYTILDLLDLIRQAGYRLLQNNGGKEALVPGPLADDGILLTEQDKAAGQKSLRLVEAMVDGLLAYDQSDLSSMNMAKYWHPGMLWYGPCGIGATQGIKEFEDYHQGPFLHAFPDRRASKFIALIAEGQFVAWAGWPGLQATHRGTYLGHPATGKQIEMRGVDWWKRDGDLLVENWVFIDMIHLFLQLGVDFLDRLQDQIQKRSNEDS